MGRLQSATGEKWGDGRRQVNSILSMEQSDEGRDRLRRLRDEIKERIDYRSFYLRYCRPANDQFSHARFQALCPVPSHNHSGRGSPSFSVDLQRGLFHCFSRDEGGDVFRFYELMHEVSFGRAIRELAREFRIEDSSKQLPLRFRAAPDAEETQQSGQTYEPLDPEGVQAICRVFLKVCDDEDQSEGVNYLQRRGIDRKTIKCAGVAYFPRRAYHRVMRRMAQSFALDELQRSGLFNSREHLTFYRHRLLFPFRVENRVIYMQARTTAAGIEPRWHNLRGNVPALYNLDALAELKSGEIVYLVEGFTDTLTLAAHGFPAVGLVGAGGLREEWLPQLARFQICLALDPDEAGRRAAARYVEMFTARGIAAACIELPSDVNDFFRNRATAALEFALLTEAAIESRK